MNAINTEGCKVCLEDFVFFYPVAAGVSVSETFPFKEVQYIGCDLTDSRYGDVELWQCKHCGSHWLHYHVAWEGFTQSGRWFYGRISKEAAEKLKPEEAVPFLESLDWFYQGGPYFFGKVSKVSGEVRVW